VIVDLDPVAGHEQAGERRALVVSYEPFHRSGLATVCPITAARSEPRYPGDVPIRAGEAGQTRDTVILTSQVRTARTSCRSVRAVNAVIVRDPPSGVLWGDHPRRSRQLRCPECREISGR
jgi:mRNA interferase MazF